MIERQPKATIDIGLNGMLPVAEDGHLLARGQRAEFCRRTMIVGSAYEEHFVSKLSAEASVDVGRQEGADQIAEMLDTIDIGNGAGDQDF